MSEQPFDKLRAGYYKPYGEVRWSSGAGMPTDKQFTSQTRLTEGYVGTLYDYVARAYDPVLGRFISADTIVPGAGNSQAFNRYMYVRGNPLGMVDPSGHAEQSPDGGGNNCQSQAFGCGNFVQDFFGGFVDQAARNIVATVTPVIVTSLAAWPDQIRTSYGAVTRLWAVASTEGIGAATSEYGDMVSGAAYSLIAPYVDPVRAGHGGETVGRVAAQLLTAKVMSKLLGGGCSFADDTEIATEQGPLTISDVVTGTRVLAWDETASTTGFYPVTQVWVHWDPVLVVLMIDGETITTTPEHPFYTPMHGWLPAGMLWVGVGLRRADGAAGLLEATRTVTRTEKLWDLTVGSRHSFFVGKQRWLVHNCGGSETDIVYRSGAPSPSNLRPRPKDNGLMSGRDSLSNPWPTKPGDRPVFAPGDDWFALNVQKLPSGSVLPDGIPPGHVSIADVGVDVLKNAIIERGKFPR